MKNLLIKFNLVCNYIANIILTILTVIGILFLLYLGYRYKIDIVKEAIKEDRIEQNKTVQ